MERWKCMYVPTAIVYHYHAGTFNEYDPFKTYYLNRNKWYTIFKNYPAGLIVRHLKHLGVNWICFAVNCIFKKKKPLLWLKIQISIILMLPSILRQRFKRRGKRKTRNTIGPKTNPIRFRREVPTMVVVPFSAIRNDPLLAAPCQYCSEGCCSEDFSPW